MSKSDHSMSRTDRFNDGDRVTRRYMRTDARTAIAESLADGHVESVPVSWDSTPVSYTTQTPTGREHLSIVAMSEDGGGLTAANVAAMTQQYEFEQACAEYTFAHPVTIQMVPRRRPVSVQHLMNTSLRNLRTVDA